MTQRNAAVPVLDTERLSLRGHAPGDLADSAAMWGDPLVTRHIGGRPSSVEETWWRLLRYAGHWAWLGFGYWVVTERATGAFVGEVGLADFKREIEPSFGGAPEIGWVLSPRVHGKGYATEAVHAVLNWADRRPAARRTVCMIDPDNGPSLRVAEKCGYREFARASYKGSASVLFERLASG